MTSDNGLPHAGKILVDSLLTHGVDTAFCVPGESYLAVLDALHDVQDRISLYVCRQDGGASFMAEAYGKLTDRPGICFVTRGPGATNASIGVHTAQQDSTPMILFVGQVGSDVVEREGFQEVDYRRMFGNIAKWVAQIDRPDRIHELVSHAFHVAMSGRPGPVVLSLPEDMLTARLAPMQTKPYQRVAANPGARDLAVMRQMLQDAQRPMVILGGGGWNAEACANIRRFAERNGLPVTCTFRRQDLFDNLHAQYAGEIGVGISPKLQKRLQESDLILCVGARLGEMTTNGYALFNVPRLKQNFVHVHPGAEELGRVYQADLLINSGMREFAEAAAALEPVDGSRWSEWTASARRDHVENSSPVEVPGPLNPSRMVEWIAKTLPRDTIVTNGAGNFSSWAHRFYPYGPWRTQLGPTNGAMGYGVPAAVAAKAVHPDRNVLCFTGDGDFMMNGQEFATAVQYGLPIIVLLFNNAMYGTIRMHQEREYPARVHGTSLTNPDFAALARAYGGHGETVRTTEEFPAAFERARASGKPAILDILLDPDVITTRATLGAIRNKAIGGGK